MTQAQMAALKMAQSCANNLLWMFQEHGDDFPDMSVQEAAYLIATNLFVHAAGESTSEVEMERNMSAVSRGIEQAFRGYFEPAERLEMIPSAPLRTSAPH